MIKEVTTDDDSHKKEHKDHDDKRDDKHHDHKKFELDVDINLREKDHKRHHE